MPVAFETLVSLDGSPSPLLDLCAKHFIHSLFYHFPDNFIDGFKIVLGGNFFHFFILFWWNLVEIPGGIF